MLIAEQSGKQLKQLLDVHAVARLGESVDHTGRISNEAIGRLTAILQDHLQKAETLGVTNVVAVATSAMRDAENRKAILADIQTRLGLTVKVISGDEEARLTYIGSAEGDGQNAVLDIGGGSTELSIGEGRIFRQGQSLNIGAVRFTERYFPGTPPYDLGPAQCAIADQLPDIAIENLTAVAGTPTTLAALELGLTEFDAQRVHGYELSAHRVEHRLYEFAMLTAADISNRHPVIHRGRADILLAGTVILHAAMQKYSLSSVTVSTRGLRYGVAIEALNQHEAL